MSIINPIMRLMPGVVLLAAPPSKAVPRFFSVAQIQQVLKADVFQKSASQSKSVARMLENSAEKVTQKAAITQSGRIINSKCKLTVDELDAAIENLMLKKHYDKNPMRNKGAVFVAMGEKYGVNPVAIIGIAMQESARGTSKAALTKNNIGGLMGRRGLMSFKTVDDCIEKMAQILQRHVKSGRDTIQKVGASGKYCAKSHSREWIKRVHHYIDKLEKKK